MNSQREMTLAEWVAQLPPIHAARKEFDQLRQRAIQAEERADRYACDNNELRAKLALAEQENVQLRVAISEAAGLLRGFIKIVERHDAAIDASGEAK